MTADNSREYSNKLLLPFDGAGRYHIYDNAIIKIKPAMECHRQGHIAIKDVVYARGENWYFRRRNI